MTENYITAIIGLAGVIIGFLLNGINTWYSKRNQIKSIRILISNEIDANLRMLSILWNKMNKADDKGNKADNKIVLARRFVSLPFPFWKQIMWYEQASILALALNENEIKKIQDIYNDLDTLKSIHSHLLMYSEKDEENSGKSTDLGFGDIKFSINHSSNLFENESLDFWDEFEKTTLKLLKEGNPLETGP